MAGRNPNPTARMRCVGVIVHRELEPAFGALRERLGRLGYVEGGNISFEPRFAQGQLDRLPGFAAELVELDVDVIVAVGAVGARAAQRLTTKIPIVFAVVLDPVATGLVATMERPGGNVTGITNFDPQQPTKQVELIKELLPTLSRLAILSDQDAPRSADGSWNPLELAYDAAARALGLQPRVFRVKGPAPDLERAFSEMIAGGAEALAILEVPVAILQQNRIAELAAVHRLPTIFPGGFSSAGGLATYGTTILDTLPRIPRYVDRILKGAEPGELPVEVVTRGELVFNLKTAQDIGLMIPTELLQRADRVIE